MTVIMALVTEAPEDLPGTPNDLDNVVDPDAQIPERKLRAEIQMSGKTLMVLEDPPGVEDTVTLMIELEITAEGREKRKAHDDYSYYRKGRLVACWLPGQSKPVAEPKRKTKKEEAAEAIAAAAEDQPELFGDLVAAEFGDTDGEDADDLDEVDRPDFSDGAE